MKEKTVVKDAMRIVSTLILIALSGLAPSARALAFWNNNNPPTDPTASAVARDRSGISAYERLESAQVTSLATEQPVLLTDAWRNRELLPFRNQRCVVEFLRHFG